MQLPSSLSNLTQGSGRDEKFDYLTVREQIMDMGDRSISIGNIASITVFKRRSSWLLKAAFILGALYSVFSIFTAPFIQMSILYVFTAVLSGVILFFLFRSKWYLSISTSDGILSLFASKDVNFLRSVKKALDERVNGTSAQTNVTFNFAKDSVGALNIDRVDTIQELSAETMVSESPGAMVASNSPGAQVGLGATVTNSTARYAGDSYSSTDSFNTAGSYNATDSYNTETAIYVDFERFMPGVEQFRNYIAEKRPNPAIEEKLDEILSLMRQGAGTQPQKSRLRDLATELSQYVQAYQPLRDLFMGIVNALS